MNRFSEQLLEAFEVAMDEKLSKLQYDKTIQATITEIKNIKTGEYKVKYQEGIITAYAKDPSEEFKIGDNVYVIVPQSDFTGKKFISHKITNNTTATGQYTDLSATIIEVSPNLSQLGIIYSGIPAGQDYWSLIAGRATPDEVQINSGVALLSSGFNKYLEKYEYLQIKAEFKTTFEQDHIKGNYGIELGFRGADGQLIPYFLDVNDFVGDPYHLWTWTPQSVVVKVSKDSIKSLAGISFYEKDFDDSLGEQTSNPNIFMRNLSLSFVKKVDLTQAPYYLTIFPQEGILFPKQSTTPIHLIGKVIHYGEDVDVEKCLFKWFKRDLSVTTEDEGYNKQAGWGWRPIKDEEGIELGSETQELTVPASAVVWQQSYKLVAIYNQEIVMTEEITLYKETSTQLYIYQTSQDNQISLTLSSGSYEGLWYYLGANGTQQLISTQKTRSQNVTPYLFYSPIVFYCSVYGKSSGSYYGELTYTMRNIESDSDVSVVFTGESIFCYDANGNIGLEYSLQEQSLAPEIVFADGVITSSVAIEWLDFKGNVISETGDGYNSSGSMIKSVRVDNNTKSLQYKIKNIFEEVPTKKNNTFKLRITTLDNQIYIFEKEIVFIKTGDPGTNGTIYTALIRPTSENKFVGAYDAAATAYSNKVVLTWKQDIQATAYNVYRRYQISDGSWTTYTKIANITSTTYTDATLVSDVTVYEYKINPSYNGVSGAPNLTPIVTIPTSGNKKFTQDAVNLKVTLQCDVYRNQSQLQLTSDNCTIKWEAYHLTLVEDPAVFGRVTVQACDANYHRYVKATIQVRDQNVSTTLYNFYGIDSITSFKNFDLCEEKDNLFLVLSKLPENIQYAANGLNPSCKMQVPQIKNFSVGIPNITEDEALLQIQTDRFVPLKEFNPSKTIAIAKLSYTKSNKFTIYHPIPMYINTFGNEAIDSWDGTEVFLGDEATHAIFAPQVGAGVKDNNTNTFTGVVMGKDSAQQRVGLYGYQAGKTSFALMEDGSAFFGKSGTGRIWINKDSNDSATIEGGGGGTNENGMTITLANTGKTNDAIRIGKDNFIVTYGGKLTAKEANIEGVLTAGAGSKIGGWNIDATNLNSGSRKTYVALDSDGSKDEAIWAGSETSTEAPFRVTKKGALVATNATITGTINASEGYIGYTIDSNGNVSNGWKINKYGIYSSKEISSNTYYVGMSIGTHNKAFYAGASKYTSSEITAAPFSVGFDGTLNATKAIITGSITANEGKIGGWIIDTYQLHSGLLYLYGGKEDSYKTSDSITDYYRIWAGASSPTSNSTKFYVTGRGKLKATDAIITGTINAKEGRLGGEQGWIIKEQQLYSSTDAANYKIKVNEAYYSDLTLLENTKQITEETLPIFNYTKESSNIVSFTFDETNNAVRYYTKNSSIEPLTEKPYIGLSSKGGIAIWAGGEKARTAPFRISHSGYLVATQATIQGKVTAESGAIGGWYLTDTQLYSGTVYLDSSKNYIYEEDSEDYYRIWAGNKIPSRAKFYVTNKGIIKATNATISGTIEAKTGYLGTADKGWTIDNSGIRSNQRPYIKSNAKYYTNLELSSNEATTNQRRSIQDCSLVPSNSPTCVEFRFQDAPTVGPYYTAINNVYSIYLELKVGSSSSTKCLWAGHINAQYAPFSVTMGGKLKATDAEITGDITATTGAIGGWSIEDNTLSSGKVYLYSGTSQYSTGDNNDYYRIWAGSSFPSVAKFYITNNGKLHATEADITGTINAQHGSIGGWIITSSQLQSATGSYYLGPDAVKLPGLTIVNGTASFSGNITSGASISSANIVGGSIKIGEKEGTNPTQYNFNVDSNGTMTANGSLSLNSNDTSSSVVSISGSMNSINCTGTLKLGTGLSSTSQGDITTYICQLHSTTGIKLEAAAGGITLKAADGIYLQDGNGNSIIQMPKGQSYNVYIARTPENIYIKNDNNQNITLASYISSSGGGGTAVFG